MSYMALYRKFRPSVFEEVKGQEAIVTTLQNQIKGGRIGHAYLFCGTRGTGKTTVAKIFAKAVNCAHPKDGSPCGECPMCRAIGEGTSMNVIEIDAASNNGVDNIREIREEVAYRPTEGRYKVYIIDEVHMLSVGAFNALLKTLEEPPEYVIFILATTEVHKIPVTILSRCQQYDFRRIPLETIAERMGELLEREGVEAEEQALRYIAKAADGSMRDALSLLDQCIAFYLGEPLTYAHVLDVLGTVDTEVFTRLLEGILARDSAWVMELTEELVMEGRELGQLALDFTWYLRNLLLLRTDAEHEEALDLSPEDRKLLKETAKQVDIQTLLRYIRVFSELSGQLRTASHKRVLFEVALLKLCIPAMETQPDSLLERIRVLEAQVEALQAQGPFGSGEGEPTRPRRKEGASEEGEAAKREAAPIKALPRDVEEVVKNFRTIAQGAHPMLRACLKKARLSLGGEDRLLLVFEDPLDVQLAGREEHLQELGRLIREKTGKEVELEVRLAPAKEPQEETYPDLEKFIHMEITVE